MNSGVTEELKPLDAPPLTTPVSKPWLSSPAGLQANAVLQRRRCIVLTLNLVTWVALLGWAAAILASGGWTLARALAFACFAMGTPWPVLGFWNAVIGFWVLHGAKDPVREAAPFTPAGEAPKLITVNTAVVMTLRNEDPARAILRLKIIKASLDASGMGGRFSYFVLSDTNIARVAAAEEEVVGAWRYGTKDADRIIYRRRENNDGFKAGNVRAFCEEHGRDFEMMLPLDADSLMTGSAIVKLVAIMQAYTKLGILQSLVVGMPSSSPFARIFQFGMRLGMRTYTMGQAWWVGDCGPFWGHNAIVRIKPYVEHCKLPVIPGPPPFGGHVLSHDQVEAVLMRRAGYEVRVMPFEDGSYEDNPPDVLEFIRRDVRWCQGNMQYVKLLGLKGLEPVSRFQLIWAILMFIGIPAWTVMIALLPALAYAAGQSAGFPVASAKALFAIYLSMSLSPKIAGYADTLITPGETARFGGYLRFSANAALELVFSSLQGAVSAIRTSMFMIGLLFGKSIVWSGQARDARGVTWGQALSALWPQTVFGLAVLGALSIISPATLIWSLPLTAGYLLAIPFAVVTASPWLGRVMQRLGVAAIPEDLAPPPEILGTQTQELGP